MNHRILEKTYKKLCKVVRKKGGSLPFGNKRGTDRKIYIRCELGHLWKTLPWNVIKGSWCSNSICLGKRISTNRAALTLPIQYKRIKKIVLEKNGKWINPIYINNHTHLNLICKNSHKFSIIPYVLFSGGWCPNCVGKHSKEEHVLELQKIAKSHGGKLISKKYFTTKIRLLWECSKKHRWKTSPASVRTSKSWCPYCAIEIVAKKVYKNKLLRLKRLRIEISALAKKKNGSLLKLEYVRIGSKIRCKATYCCSLNHKWVTDAYWIKKNIWCPICNSPGVREKICRVIIEWVTGYSFPKSRPIWLLNSRNKKMELDGYCEKLKLAFEHQGQQHSEFQKFFHKTKFDLLIRKRDDKTKQELCKKYGITLILIDMSIPLEDLQSFIKIEIVKSRKDLQQIINKNYFDYTSVSLNKENEINKCNEVASKNGGICLSKHYINNSTKLEWECVKGHKWFAVPSSIFLGTWCPKCKNELISKSKEVDIEPIKSLIISKGGTLLNIEIVNYKRNYKVRCAKGHEWNTTRSKLNIGMWCRICSARRNGLRLKLKIEDLQKLAISRGGKLLSEHYIKAAVRMLWQCDKKHLWIANATSVKKRSWCPVCSGKLSFEYKGNIDNFIELERKLYLTETT